MQAEAFRTFSSSLRNNDTVKSSRLTMRAEPTGDKSQPMFNHTTHYRPQERPCIPRNNNGNHRTICGVTNARKAQPIKPNTAPVTASLPPPSRPRITLPEHSEYTAKYTCTPATTVTASTIVDNPQPPVRVPEPEPLPSSVQIPFRKLRQTVNEEWAHRNKLASWSLAHLPSLSKESSDDVSLDSSSEPCDRARVTHALSVLSGAMGDLNSREWFRDTGILTQSSPTLTRADVASALLTYGLALSPRELNAVLNAVVGRKRGDMEPRAEFVDVASRLKCDRGYQPAVAQFARYYGALMKGGLGTCSTALSAVTGSTESVATAAEGADTSVTAAPARNRRPRSRIGPAYSPEDTVHLLRAHFSQRNGRESLKHLGVGRLASRADIERLCGALSIRMAPGALDEVMRALAADSRLLVTRDAEATSEDDRDPVPRRNALLLGEPTAARASEALALFEEPQPTAVDIRTLTLADMHVHKSYPRTRQSCAPLALPSSRSTSPDASPLPSPLPSPPTDPQRRAEHRRGVALALRAAEQAALQRERDFAQQEVVRVREQYGLDIQDPYQSTSEMFLKARKGPANRVVFPPVVFTDALFNAGAAPKRAPAAAVAFGPLTTTTGSTAVQPSQRVRARSNQAMYLAAVRSRDDARELRARDMVAKYDHKDTRSILGDALAPAPVPAPTPAHDAASTERLMQTYTNARDADIAAMQQADKQRRHAARNAKALQRRAHEDRHEELVCREQQKTLERQEQRRERLLACVGDYNASLNGVDKGERF